jgi:hypothetical protein
MITHPAEKEKKSIGVIDDLISSCEAALILDRAPDTVRLMARRGRLVAAVATRAGRLFRRRDVEELAKRLQPRTIGGSGRRRG